MASGKSQLVASFLKHHPKSASVVLTKNGTGAIKTIIENYAANIVGKTLNNIPPLVLEEALREVDERQIAKLTEYMQLNLISRIFRKWLQSGLNKRVETTLSIMESKLAKAITKLISYPENMVGSIMNPAPFTVSPNLTTREVLSLLNKNKNRYSRYVYVVDHNQVVLGVIPFKEAFYSEKSALVSKIMTSNVFSFRPDHPIKDALSHPNWLEWDSIPITDSHNVLLGVVRFDSLKSDQPPTTDANAELIKASAAVGEVFQIGLNATVSALGLMGDKK